LNYRAKEFLQLISELKKLTGYHKDFTEPEEEKKANEKEDFDWLFIQNEIQQPQNIINVPQ